VNEETKSTQITVAYAVAFFSKYSCKIFPKVWEFSSHKKTLFVSPL